MALAFAFAIAAKSRAPQDTDLAQWGVEGLGAAHCPNFKSNSHNARVKLAGERDRGIPPAAEAADLSKLGLQPTTIISDLVKWRLLIHNSYQYIKYLSTMNLESNTPQWHDQKRLPSPMDNPLSDSNPHKLGLTPIPSGNQTWQRKIPCEWKSQ